MSRARKPRAAPAPKPPERAQATPRCRVPRACRTTSPKRAVAASEPPAGLCPAALSPTRCRQSTVALLHYDLGCGAGASPDYGGLRFDARRAASGWTNAAKVAKARERGDDVGDDIGVDKQVCSWTSASRTSRRRRRIAGAAARRDRLPLHLAPRTRRTCASRVCGSTAERTRTRAIRISDYCRIFDRLGPHRLQVDRYVKRIADAGHPAGPRATYPPNRIRRLDAARHRPSDIPRNRCGARRRSRAARHPGRGVGAHRAAMEETPCSTTCGVRGGDAPEPDGGGRCGATGPGTDCTTSNRAGSSRWPRRRPAPHRPACGRA